MALYNDIDYLAKSSHNDFTVEFKPGSQPPHSGIYRCMGCGPEIVAEENRQFPPQNHHEHNSAQGNIRWRMIVYADHKAK